MADNSRSSSFFKNLRNSIPWNGGALLDLENEIDLLNPIYKVFENKGSKRTDILQRHSITYGNNNDEPTAIIGGNNNPPLYANIQENKLGRIKDYRIMAAYPVVSECLDDICNEMINLDDVNNIIKIDLEKIELNDNHKKELEDEFKDFVGIYDFEQNGWDYCRRLLVEGELFFEHIIDTNNPGLGILGVVPIPTELIDPIYDNMQNFMIRGFLERKPIIDPRNPNKIERYDMIPMDKNQVAYMNSGIWNEDMTCRIPYIENGRKDYRRLSLIEDSIVIYRLARAPERLVFNIDVGSRNPLQAEQYLRTLMNGYWNKKTIDISNGGTVQKFDPQSMLDAFWFPKRKGSEGSSVTTLAGGCLAMDTKVPLLDGRTLTISEISDELKQNKKLYVYSTNPYNGHIVPGIISWAGITQQSAKVMKITFDNNKSVTCTLDHKFPILGKGFVEAQNLKIGESMIPLYTKQQPLNKNNKLDYELIFQNDTKKWEYTHRMVMDYCDKDRNNVMIFNEQHCNNPKQYTRHHKNFNRFDNSPENLVWMYAKENSDFRKEVYSKVSNGIKQKYSNMEENEYNAFIKLRTSKLIKNENYIKHIKENTNQQTFIFDDLIIKTILDNAYNYKNIKEYVNILNNDKELLNHFNKLNKNQHIRNQNNSKYVFKYTHIQNIVKKAGYKNIKHYKHTYQYHNHKIINIEFLDEPITVGTLRIDDEHKWHNYHTFALDCGVFTKNSNLDKLEDLYFFKDGLYKSLGVPTNRSKPDAKAPTQSNDLLREELRFARLIIRLQKLISTGIKNSFITHLKLKKYTDNISWWKEFGLSEDEIKIKLNPPSNYYQLREIQKLELSMNCFNTAKSTNYISPSLAAKDYLKWDDTKLQANQEWRRKDAGFEWEIAQITAQGPAWKELLKQNMNQNNPDPSAMGVDIGGSTMPSPSMDNGGTGGADDVPPDFGQPAVDVQTDTSANQVPI